MKINFMFLLPKKYIRLLLGNQILYNKETEMTKLNTLKVKKLEKAVIVKYEDLRDTILVIEAIKAQTEPGRKWNQLKKELIKNV